jgi:release factor glutamine methyltransferase
VTSLASRRCEFGPLSVEYDGRVLEPRPWTLLQSRWAAELATGAAPGPILELCAGAGQIGLAAAVLAGRDLVQVEADPTAADYARANARRAGYADRVEVRTARAERALSPDERFAIVLADPPYLPTRQVSRWPADPVTAIDGGGDGLDVIRACLATAAAHLVPGGPLLLQVAGAAQADEVADLVAGGGWPLRAGEVRSHDPERAVLLLTRQ